ncbi:GPI-anchored protein LLG1-like [Cicer arietinum]|uniref:GPI-anchored protein LLG1-like n=1 Tax=Cicer arietinum TaxID=3827 RepID=A0A1S2Y5L9_CICAR|nr:GPI-anchored protein LLG1-like [Cicer arietinum]
MDCSLNQQSFLLCSSILLIMAISVSSFHPTFLPNTIFDSQELKGRHLLQAKQGCSVNFEFLNYTIITSKCKGPRYPAKPCCASFKEFACPYADVLNDLTNDCASTMFSYINLYGHYPPGLFASECREGKSGLACPAMPPSVSADDTSNQIVYNPSLLLVLTACIFIVLLV